LPINQKLYSYFTGYPLVDDLEISVLAAVATATFVGAATACAVMSRCRDVPAGLSQVLYGLVAVELSSARASSAYLICKATRRATEPQMDALPHGGRCSRSPSHQN